MPEFEAVTLHSEFEMKERGGLAAFSIGRQVGKFVLGFNLMKLLKLGFVFERGFHDRLEGAYNIRMLRTSGPPIDPSLHNVTLDVDELPNVEGSAMLSLRDFNKESFVFKESGKVNIGGYTGIAGGLQFLIFGVYMGAEMPTDPPDFGSFYIEVTKKSPVDETLDERRRQAREILVEHLEKEVKQGI